MVSSSCTNGNVRALTLANGRVTTGYLDLIRLTPLLQRTRGIPEIKIGLIDGPVAIYHPDLATENIREVPGELLLVVPGMRYPRGAAIVPPLLERLVGSRVHGQQKT
jgi:hypothetical protein